MNILIPIDGLIDKKAEIARLRKLCSALEKDIDRVQSKLGNPGFVNKAPAPIVDKEKGKLMELENSLEDLK